MGHLSCSRQLLRWLNGRGIFHLCQIIKEQRDGVPVWYSDDGLILPVTLLEDWNAFILDLRSHGFSWNQSGDRLTWEGPRINGMLVVKGIYKGFFCNLDYRWRY